MTACMVRRFGRKLFSVVYGERATVSSDMKTLIHRIAGVRSLSVSLAFGTVERSSATWNRLEATLIATT